jgi:beta-1,2-mannosidase
LYNVSFVKCFTNLSIIRHITVNLTLDGTYASGQVILDKNNPTKILERMDTYFMKPDQPYELSGQTNNVCFVEGLANFNNKWFLYYGTADSKIAVTIKQ